MARSNQKPWQIVTSLFRLLLAALFILGLLQFIVSFFGSRAYAEGTDYVQFYLAGKLFAAGDFSTIYPINNNFNHSHFQEMARILFPLLPQEGLPVFLYPPSAAMIFSLLSFLKFDDSFIVWKLLSLASAIISIYALVKSFARPAKEAWIIMFYFVALFSGIEVIVLGQTTLVFNFLPLIAGLICWKKNKNFLAGISWSLLALKPQSMLIVLPIICLSAFTENKKGIRSLLIGLALGILTLTLTAMEFSNINLLNNWLATVKAWQQYIACDFKQSTFGVISLADTLTLNAPHQWRLLVARITSVCSLAFLAWELYVLNGIAGNKTISLPNRKDLMLSMAVLFYPLISPYVTEVDLCLFVLPFTLSYLHKQDNKPIWSYLFCLTLIIGLLVRLHQILIHFSLNTAVIVSIILLAILSISLITIHRPLESK